MESNSLSFIIIVFCIMRSAYFSATETAFSSLNRIRIKNMAEKGNRKAALVMRLSENYDSLLTPANFLFKQWKKLLSLVFNSSNDSFITEEELLTIVEEAEQEGGIDAQEGTLIRSAIEFSELEAADILTPRIDVTGISSDAGKDEIAEVFMQTGYSRLPVYEESIDNIIGIIYQKDFHNYIAHTDKKIEAIIRPALFISKRKHVGALLGELQQKKSHIAVVLDEFGGTIGIITLEDILEELVGEIWDEHDKVVNEIEKITETEYLVMGNANIEKVFELFGKEEELEVLTMSGWVMEQIGQIPVEGSTFTYEDLKVQVVKMARKRVEKVQITILPEPAAEG